MPPPAIENHQPIDGAARECFERTIGPGDGDSVVAVDVSQSVMNADVVAGQITGCRAGQTVETALARLDHNLGAIGIALEGRVVGADLQPMSVFWNIVSEDARLPTAIGHHDVDFAV